MNNLSTEYSLEYLSGLKYSHSLLRFRSTIRTIVFFKFHVFKMGLFLCFVKSIFHIKFTGLAELGSFSSAVFRQTEKKDLVCEGVHVGS